MLFRRRTAQTALQKIRNLLWPKMGWTRVIDYYKNRIVRLPAGEYSIASGLAFGCSVSWTPTFGTHLLQCLLFCWIARANWAAAFLGSAFGNPWTTPALMFISYHVGKALFISTGHGDIIHNDSEQTFTTFLKTMLEGDVTWDMFTVNFNEFILPTLVGGYTMGLATFPLFYFPFYFMVKAARIARKKQIENRAHRDIVEVTGQAE